MKKIAFLILLTSYLFSLSISQQNFYAYKLYDNEFTAMFPTKPTRQEIPKELLDPEKIEASIPYEYRKKLTQQKIDRIVATIIKKNNVKAYQYVDSENGFVITSQSMVSPLNNDVGTYKKTVKETLDKSIVKSTEASGNNIISFSSKFDKGQNMYIAIFSSSYFMSNQKVYTHTKQIIYKNKIYKWTIQSLDTSSKDVFDEYAKFCKVLK